MRSLRFSPLALALLTGLTLSSGPAHPQAGGKGAEAVDIVTADGVELKGHFYASSKPAANPTVLLLHDRNEDSNKAEWISLARALNDAGYSVLRFDFRGHGNSTTVRPGVPDANPLNAQRGFWDEAPNAVGIRNYRPGGPRPTTIDAKQFTPSYYRILANDIAAAKAFLDERNNSGQCNSANLVLIGAREGATLGALWLNSEWHRYPARDNKDYHAKLNPFVVKWVPDLKNPMGQYVTAAVWLSISPNLGGPNSPVNPAAMLLKAGRDNKVPMLFFYADGDPYRATAINCEKAIKSRNKNDYPSTAATKIPKADKFSGSALLQKSLGTIPAIVKYLDNTVRGRKLTVKNFPADLSIWQVGREQLRSPQEAASWIGLDARHPEVRHAQLTLSRLYIAQKVARQEKGETFSYSNFLPFAR